MQGEMFGHVRFATAEQASAALAKLQNEDGKATICDCPATIKPLEGEAETQYFRQVSPCAAAL